MSPTIKTAVSCQCGQVEVTVKGVPILVAACYCDDCQAAFLPPNETPTVHSQHSLL